MNIIKKIYCRSFQTVFRIALPILPYREPNILSSVDEIIPILKKKNMDSVLLVTDKGIRNLKLTEPLEILLKDNDINCFVYDETVPNPTIDNVEAAREMYLTNNCKCIIAFGGGSSMDCAKACGARIAKPKQSIPKMRGILKIHKKLPLLIAIPTTAGTGSETTLAAVITDGKLHHKYPINDFSLIPHYAVLDYRTTVNLPKHITSTTGMDALTHAVEAYIGRSTTKYTRKRAIEAVNLIYNNLKTAYDDGTNKEARSNMLHAAYSAGIAFTQSYVGYVHAIAHSLGGQYGTPHGLANAVILPIALREYGAVIHKKLAKLALESGVVTNNKMTDSEIATRFIQWVQDMNDYLQIPRNIPEIKDEDIAIMSKHADTEGNPLYPVPTLMDKNELSRWYKLIRDNK